MISLTGCGAAKYSCNHMINFDIKGETTTHHESDEGFLWNIHLYIILMSGDVHPNPGPTDTSVVPLKMCHLNVRSICADHLTKLDIIYSKLCIEKSFDIICISETWLDNSVSDDEITLDGYSLYRKECNQHGGRVAVFVCDRIGVKILKLLTLKH